MIFSIKWNDGYYEWTYRLTNNEFQSLVANGRFTLISSSRGEDVVYDTHQKRQSTYYPIGVPEILDVANPFNNIYKNGIGNYFSKDPHGSFHPGTGNWTRFAELIHTFDLTVPVEQY